MGGKTQIANIKWDIYQDPAHFFPSSKVGNISIIVRLEFDRFRYRHNRIKKTYKRYFLPKNVTNKMKDIDTYE